MFVEVRYDKGPQSKLIMAVFSCALSTQILLEIELFWN